MSVKPVIDQIPTHTPLVFGALLLVVAAAVVPVIGRNLGTHVEFLPAFLGVVSFVDPLPVDLLSQQHRARATCGTCGWPAPPSCP